MSKCDTCAFDDSRDHIDGCKRGVKPSLRNDCSLYVDVKSVKDSYDKSFQKYRSLSVADLVQQIKNNSHGCNLGPKACFACADVEAGIAALRIRLLKPRDEATKVLEEIQASYRKTDMLLSDINDSIMRTAGQGHAVSLNFLQSRMETLMKHMELFDKHFEEWKKRIERM